MKITFYGTAAAEGVPALYCDCDLCEATRKLGGKNIRTRSQSMINDDLLIDFPADTYLHVLNYGLPLHKIQNIIITHSHADHLYPAEFWMRGPSFSNMGTDKPLNIYGSSSVVETIESNPNVCKLKEMGYVNITRLNAFETVNIGGYDVTPLPAGHQAEAEAFIYLIGKDGKNLLYAHDTGFFPDATMQYLSENKPHFDFATFDCCYSLRHCSTGHMGFDEVMEMKGKLSEIGTITEKTVCCINHFSHFQGKLYEDMRDYASKYGYLTSHDGMEVEF